MFDFNVAQTNYIQRRQSKKEIDISKFRTKIADASFKLLSTGTKTFPPPRRGNLVEQYNFNFKGQDDVFLTSEVGWLFYAVLKDAIELNDNNRIKSLESIFLHRVINQDVVVCDQVTFGMSAILFYKLTNRPKYKEYIDKLYKWLVSRETQYGILYRDGTSLNLIDGLGMFTPFLILYSENMHCPKAYSIAVRQLEIYNKYGVDKETGIPSHGFSLREPHIKMGSINWGRGLSWYSLGLLDIQQADLSVDDQLLVKMYQKTICSYLNEKKMLGQFVGEENVDLSATLPILYYLSHQKVIKLTSNEVLEFSAYAHNGVLYNSSGSTMALNRYSEFDGTNPLAQAFMLLLLMDEYK
jgi:rhamnogalacturonyl hydrolase YesR